MPVVNRIAAFAEDMTAWRRHLHARPELGQRCEGTAAFVAGRLREWGADEIHEGVAVSGVVAVIKGSRPGPAVALRADMDALPIEEATGAAHASTVPGRMHACGHDGHTAMLLGAARYLAETRRFAGQAVLLFQPAEETGGGAELMVAEGVLERFGIARAFALHAAPGTPIGQFTTTPGPIMAAVDTFTIRVAGHGGHAARPQDTRDPILPLCAMVQAIQTITTRDRDPLRTLVCAVSQVHAGTVDNVVPATAMLNGTVRTFDGATRDTVRRRLAEIAEGIAAAHGVTATLDWLPGYPPTVNDPAETAFAASVAAEVSSVITDLPPEMGSEDFAFILDRVPGAYLFVGVGDTAGLHHPAFDFADEALPFGASFLARAIERALPLEP